ncbi:unnamed protein product [Amoebophrya sp. A25]|nr:unnamed protein product [Amoebophrya sp. A25]|eukprot:GSA25T00004400001.1
MLRMGDDVARREDAERAQGCWDSARVDDLAAQAAVRQQTAGGPCRLVFGYGSLIWRVDFPYTRKFVARLPGKAGYLRRMWMKSADHRGTPAAPGRVCTLVTASRGEDIIGICYELPEEEADSILKQLDYRERHGYTRTVTQVDQQDGTTAETFLYFCMQELPTTAGSEAPSALVWNEPLEETAAIIARAVGPSGKNLEYLENLCSGLSSITFLEDKEEKQEENQKDSGFVDAYLEKLLANTRLELEAVTPAA